MHLLCNEAMKQRYQRCVHLCNGVPCV